MIRVGVLTVSDMGPRGLRADTSGEAIREALPRLDGREARYAIIPDERERIALTLREWADSGEVDLILTTGGTGLGPRDVTPEATRDVLEREAPGLGEAMRADTLRKTPFAMISRQVAGARGRCLIVNLPGSPKAVRECLEVVLPVLPHAVELLRGKTDSHPTA